jgi:hypothetical protein
MNHDQDGIRRLPTMILAWAWVGLPLGYGVYQLIQKLAQLFNG